MGLSKHYLAAIALMLGLTPAWAQSHDSLGPKGVLTAQRQKVLAAALVAHGGNFAIPDNVAKRLGVAKSEAGAMRQLSLNSGSDARHVYAPLSHGGFLLGFVDATTAQIGRFDSHLKLVAAVKPDAMGSAIPLSDAKGLAQIEIGFWSDIADRLQDEK